MIDTETRNKLIASINKSVDANQCLGADAITDGILNDFLDKDIKDLIKRIETAHDALSAVYASGEVRCSDVIEMINLGLDNKPQHKHTRF